MASLEEEKAEVSSTASPPVPQQSSLVQQGEPISQGGNRLGIPWKSSSSDNTKSKSAFEARRSTRVSGAKFSQADGDTWQETLAVCEMTDEKLSIRSYYTNTRTKQRVWDEPPSGASHIRPATEDMRRMAAIQLQDMQLALGTTIPDASDANSKKKRGFFRRNKVSSSKSSSSEANVDANGKPLVSRIQYKSGSFLGGTKKTNSRDDTLDPALQKAIALSMAEADGRYDANEFDPVIYSEVTYKDDADEIAMVMALSLSEVESVPQPHEEELSEEEMFRRALQESKLMLAASVPQKETREEDLLGVEESPSYDDESDKKIPATFPDDELERKMPAKPAPSQSLQTNKSTYAQLPSEATVKAGDKKIPATFPDDELDQKMPAKQPSKRVQVKTDTYAQMLSGATLRDNSGATVGSVDTQKEPSRVNARKHPWNRPPPSSIRRQGRNNHYDEIMSNSHDSRSHEDDHRKRHPYGNDDSSKKALENSAGVV